MNKLSTMLAMLAATNTSQIPWITGRERTIRNHPLKPETLVELKAKAEAKRIRKTEKRARDDERQKAGCFKEKQSV